MLKITFQEHISEKKITQPFTSIKPGQAFFATWGVFEGFFLLTTGYFILYFGTNTLTPPVVTTANVNTVFENYIPVDAEMHITFTKR